MERPFTTGMAGGFVAVCLAALAVAGCQKGEANAQGRPGDAVERAAMQIMARMGDADAQNSLGVMMMDGKGGPKDGPGARQWLLKAVQQGNPAAEFNLGLLEDKGLDGPPNPAGAREWFMKAGQHGLADAQFNVGIFYRDGEGGPQDFVKAREWLMKAAAQGHTSAAFNLGVFDATGQGGPINYAAARAWFEKAKTPESVAYMDAKIAGERGDHAQERALLTPIAEGGTPIAQYDLGMMYLTGKGGPVSEAEARKWLQKAADKGVDEAQDALRRIPAER
jgi:hypothetical protein